MPEQDSLNPAPDGAESQVTDVTEPSTEVDIDKSDNVQQLRDYAKGLKTDLGKYKTTHEFVQTKFGDVKNAELASDIYASFAGDEFDPDKFLSVVTQLSPSRAKALTDKLTSTQTEALAKVQVEKMFGGKVTDSDVKLFKEWKETGYGLGDGEDIPEALKFNSDGTPKSDEEIEFLRNLQKQVKETQQFNQNKELTEKEALELETQENLKNQVNAFSSDRLKVLDSEFKVLGLADADGDTAEVRTEKDMLRDFLRDGIAGAFMKNPESSRDYVSAIEHIQKGEPLLARRYEASIETKLLGIMRSKPMERMLKFLTESQTPRLEEERPEISTSGASTEGGNKTEKPLTGDEMYDKLVREGKLKA